VHHSKKRPRQGDDAKWKAEQEKQRRETAMANTIGIRTLAAITAAVPCSLTTVLGDILGLTKINFNTCLYNDRLPVTIRFANEVGDVLISAPLEGEPRLPFKFYI
jgi:hypothetical protein